MSYRRGGGVPAQTGELAKLIVELRGRLKSYGDELARNEMLIRYCIVDPLLRALGWDLENPDQVVPEYTGRRRMRPDYLLYDAGGRPLAAIEVKALGRVEEAEREVVRVTRATGVHYIIVTDGEKWHLYSSSQRLEEPPLFEWDLLEGSPEEVARVVRIIANTEDFGKPEAVVSLGPLPVSGTPKCPYCGFGGEHRLLKTWKFRFYDVRKLKCPKCHGIFNRYYGVSPGGRVSEFVIRVKPRR